MVYGFESIGYIVSRVRAHSFSLPLCIELTSQWPSKGGMGGCELAFCLSGRFLSPP